MNREKLLLLSLSLICMGASVHAADKETPKKVPAKSASKIEELKKETSGSSEVATDPENTPISRATTALAFIRSITMTQPQEVPFAGQGNVTTESYDQDEDEYDMYSPSRNYVYEVPFGSQHKSSK